MNMKDAFLKEFPSDASKAVVIMSGGMDSAIAARLTVEKLGAENVHALSFFYRQKQSVELKMAEINSKKLGIAKHLMVDISFLGDMVRGVSANISGGMDMPTIKDILGDPQPITYVPNRNAILLMIGASYAEANGIDLVITGLQAQDEYAYWDTTPSFVSSVNSLLSQNRQKKVRVHAPFMGKNKAQELELLQALDGHVDLLKTTITCYNPEGDVSCGKCPSCAERIANFKKAKLIDPIKYAINIQW
jgi:7-cyano-7-deazaguanine synthase